MRSVCVLCVSGCQLLRWCCVTAAVQPLELAAHNDTLDILMMLARVHYWRCLPPPLQPDSVLLCSCAPPTHFLPITDLYISVQSPQTLPRHANRLLLRNRLIMKSTFSTGLHRKISHEKCHMDVQNKCDWLVCVRKNFFFICHVI